MTSHAPVFKSNRGTVVDHLASLLMTFCKSKEEKMPPKISELIVRILLLHPKWKDKLELEWSKNNIQDFMQECFQFYFDETSLSSATVKMQCLFYGKYLTKDQFKTHKREVVMKKCNHLLQKLKKLWHNLGEDFSIVHSDLVKFILIKEGMDDEDDPSAYDEIKTALDSLLPASEFSFFVSNNQKAKVAIMNEISSIASGIRLHAWTSNKAGKYLFDVVKLMKETLPKVSEEIHEELSRVTEINKGLQAFIEKGIAKDEESAELTFKKQLLINTTNYLNFITILKEHTEDIAAESYKLDYKFAITTKKLNGELKKGPFIKADKAYPLYKEISQIWKKLQLEGYLLNFYSNLFFETKAKHELAYQITQPSNLELLNFHGISEETSKVKPVVITPKSVKNFKDITLETRDFCTYYSSLGVLVPVDRDIGIIMYENSFYGFSSHKAQEYFLQHPKTCIEILKKNMESMPELVITMGKEASFGFPIINMMIRDEVLPLFISEKSEQTALHSIEENKDFTYNWNQWSMRKEAIKYVDLLNKKTNSTQTDLSHFRRENFSQVYLPKDNWTQTRKDASTAMARPGIPEL